MANLLYFAQYHQFSIGRIYFWTLFSSAIQKWLRFLDAAFFYPEGRRMALAFLSWILKNLCPRWCIWSLQRGDHRRFRGDKYLCSFIEMYLGKFNPIFGSNNWTYLQSTHHFLRAVDLQKQILQIHEFLNADIRTEFQFDQSCLVDSNQWFEFYSEEWNQNWIDVFCYPSCRSDKSHLLLRDADIHKNVWCCLFC